MKRVMAVLAAMVLVGVMVAAPASADTKPINGKVYMEFVGPAEIAPSAGETGRGSERWRSTG